MHLTKIGGSSLVQGELTLKEKNRQKMDHTSNSKNKCQVWFVIAIFPWWFSRVEFRNLQKHSCNSQLWSRDCNCYKQIIKIKHVNLSEIELNYQILKVAVLHTEPQCNFHIVPKYSLHISHKCDRICQKNLVNSDLSLVNSLSPVKGHIHLLSEVSVLPGSHNC